jgi:hypothetical protein
MNLRTFRVRLVTAATGFLLLLANLGAQAEPAHAPAAKPAAAQSNDSAKEEALPPVLPPEQFFGPAAMGYAAAKGCAQICFKLFCYCGCDITDNHKCLLDCFTGYHGADCHICQEEAMVALRMSKNDESLATIQKAIDEGYSSKYPFKEESPALKHYKATRKWQSNAAGQASDPGQSTCCSPKK